MSSVCASDISFRGLSLSFESFPLMLTSSIRREQAEHNDLEEDYNRFHDRDRSCRRYACGKHRKYIRNLSFTGRNTTCEDTTSRVCFKQKYKEPVDC